jgi:hypothetical protein
MAAIDSARNLIMPRESWIYSTSDGYLLSLKEILDAKSTAHFGHSLVRFLIGDGYSLLPCDGR